MDHSFNCSEFNEFSPTWASKVRPVWQRFSALQRMKPGRISSSSMPLSRNFKFSPGPASSVSTSSESRLSTSTVCCKQTRQAWMCHSENSCHKSWRFKVLYYHNLTLLGIITSCWALLIDPDSNFPNITVPMSCKNTHKHLLKLKQHSAK